MPPKWSPLLKMLLCFWLLAMFVCSHPSCLNFNVILSEEGLLPFCHLTWFMIFIAFNRRRRWHPTPVLLPGKSHGWRSLVGCSPQGREESDTTERLPFHFSLSCIGGGNGNPLQCSCLENPRDRGAWWAAICGFAQSRTRLKRLSSSSSSVYKSYIYTTI